VTADGLTALILAALTAKSLAALAALTAEHLAAITLAALTAEGLAALTLGGEMMGLGEVWRMKGFLKGDLDLDTEYEVFLDLLKPFEGECGLSGTEGATDMGGGEIKPEYLGVLTSSGD
nr:hypothetical protein [Tanacetum cinerariifolium]